MTDGNELPCAGKRKPPKLSCASRFAPTRSAQLPINQLRDCEMWAPGRPHGGLSESAFRFIFPTK